MATAVIGLAEHLNEDSRPAHSNVSSLTFRRILEQEETCTTFVFLAKQTGSLLRSLATDLLQIELPKHVTYLLDCDVVRNYAERRLSDTPQMFAVEALFETDDTPYMLPGGAFQEMIEWLGKDLHLDDLVQSESTLTKQEFLLELLARLEDGISDQDASPLRGDELLDRLIEKIARDRMILRRFLSFLANDRFQGVRLNFRDDIRERFYEALKHIERHENRFRPSKGKAAVRKKKDLRDAINISMSAASSEQPARETAYILITQTEAVLKLSRCLSPTTADDLFDGLLFQTQSLPPIRVMTPAQVYLARQLRKWNPDVELTIAEIDKYTQSFAELASWMTQFLLDRRRERPFVLEEFAATPQFKVLERAFENLRKAYGSLNSSLWFVERFRRAQMRVQDLREQTLLGHEDDGPSCDLESTQAAKLMREAETLVDALHLAAEALERKTPLEYGSQISDGEHERMFRLKVIVRSGEDEDHLMSGEVYIANYEKDRHFDSYALRWEATCTVDRFLIAMSSIFQPFVSNIKAQSSQRSLLTLSKEYHRVENSDGVIAIYTEGGIFYTDLRAVVVGQAWKSLRIQGLRRSIFKHFLSLGKKFSPADVPEIRKLRICSRYGDFIIDAQGSDYGSIPRITVISSVNLGREIGYLARATMCHPVSGKKLAAHLDSVFRRMEFVRPTQSPNPQMGERAVSHA